MNPDREQLLGVARSLLAASGPIAAILVRHGYSAEEVHAWFEIATILLAVLPPIIAASWSYSANSRENKIANLKAMPASAKAEVLAAIPQAAKILAVSEMSDVSAVVIKDAASAPAVAMAQQYDLPKVVTEKQNGNGNGGSHGPIG